MLVSVEWTGYRAGYHESNIAPQSVMTDQPRNAIPSIKPEPQSCTHWNDPARNRKPSSTGVVEYFNHRRTHYSAGGKMGLFKQLLIALKLRKPVKANYIEKNWHYSEVDTIGEVLSFQCSRDGKRFDRIALIPPEHPQIPIRHI